MCPEGPELARSRDVLRDALVNSIIVDSSPGPIGRYRESPPPGQETFVGRLPMSIDSVDVKGKFMWWTVYSPATHELVHICTTYGMSGQWTFDHPGDRNVAYTFTLADGRIVKFVDPRRFGTIRFMNESSLRRKLTSLGPDMLNHPPEPEEFTDRIRRAPGTIVEVLMDQSVVSGIGNYVKCESLYLAGVSPHRIASSLTRDEADDLYEAIVTVMKSSYRDGGATIRTYSNVDGRRGSAQDDFVVYGRKVDFMDRTVVRERTKDGRTTHWVPDYQR